MGTVKTGNDRGYKRVSNISSGDPSPARGLVFTASGLTNKRPDPSSPEEGVRTVVLESNLRRSWPGRGEPGRGQRGAQGALTKTLVKALNVHLRELVAKDDEEI
jgi:hypothetical protein